MSLEIFTARVGYDGQDALVVARQLVDEAESATGRPHPGAPFAPSWRILGPALRARKAGDAGYWARYEREYRDEMRARFLLDQSPWRALVERQGQVTLLCLCTDPARCHRTLLAAFLEKVARWYQIPGVAFVGERGYASAADARRAAVGGRS